MVVCTGVDDAMCRSASFKSVLSALCVSMQSLLQCIRLEEWNLKLAIFKIALLNRSSGVLSFSQWSTRCMGSIVVAACAFRVHR